MHAESSPTPELQFDHLDTPDLAGRDDGVPQTVTCSACGATLQSAYYSVDDASVCAPCKAAVEQRIAPVREWRLLLRSALFGLGAALLGAAIYYGVIALTDFEIGIVAILTGYLVGAAVRRGARGRGGRRLQLLAVALTYFSVALAYLPLALRGMEEADDAEGTAMVTEVPGAGAASQPAPAPAPGSAEPQPAGAAAPAATEEVPTTGEFLLALAAVLGFTLVLPVLVIVGSLPSGLISALIIGIGMQQAWRMTGVARPKIQGPFRIAAPAEAPEAAGV